MIMARAVTSARTLAGTWIGLLLLTGLSFLLSLAGFRPGLELAVALGIALAKSTLVVLIFMHWLEQRSMSRLVILVAALYVLILGGLTAADVATRRTFPTAPGETMEQP